MQLLAEVSGRQPGQAWEAGCGNALAVRAMATQASHGGGVGPALGEDFLAIGGMRRGPGQDQQAADHDASERCHHESPFLLLYV
ncbi:hypothetical protein D3C85_1800910 [compost metagenome]